MLVARIEGLIHRRETEPLGEEILPPRRFSAQELSLVGTAHEALAFAENVLLQEDHTVPVSMGGAQQSQNICSLCHLEHRVGVLRLPIATPCPRIGSGVQLDSVDADVRCACERLVGCVDVHERTDPDSAGLQTTDGCLQLCAACGEVPTMIAGHLSRAHRDQSALVRTDPENHVDDVFGGLALNVVLDPRMVLL